LQPFDIIIPLIPKDKQPPTTNQQKPTSPTKSNKDLPLPPVAKIHTPPKSLPPQLPSTDTTKSNKDLPSSPIAKIHTPPKSLPPKPPSADTAQKKKPSPQVARKEAPAQSSRKRVHTEEYGK